MIYEFNLGHNISDTTKKICYVKSEGAVDHCTVKSWVKNLDNQARLCRPKIMDSEVVLQTIETNLASST